MGNSVDFLPTPFECEKTLAIKCNPRESMDAFCHHIAAGGSLLNLCKSLKISFTHIVNWIREDRERSKRYDKALEDSKEWLRARVLDEFSKLAFVTPRKLYDEKGQMLPFKDWPKETADAVKKITLHGDGSIKVVEFWPKENALEKLGEEGAGMFKKKVEHSGHIHHSAFNQEVRRRVEEKKTEAAVPATGKEV